MVGANQPEPIAQFHPWSVGDEPNRCNGYFAL